MILALVLFVLSTLVSAVGLSLRGQAEKVILFLVAAMLSTASAGIAVFSALGRNVQIDTLASAFFSAFALYSIYLLLDSLRDI